MIHMRQDCLVTFRLMRTCVRMISYKAGLFGDFSINTYMCIHDSYKAGLFGDFQINTYMCTHESHEAGLFGDFRLMRTCVPMILIRQDRLVHFRLIRTYVCVIQMS